MRLGHVEKGMAVRNPQGNPESGGKISQSMAIYGNRKTLPFSHGKIWKRFDSSMGFPPLKQPQAVAFETAAVGAMQPGIGRVPQQAG
jgi:hypothetical protein